MTDYVVSHAVISEDGLYRYALVRRWNVGAGWPVLGVVMLNPSTADASKDDATIRKVVAIAKARGYGGIYVCNLFAYRSTDPGDLITTDNIVGPANDAHLSAMADTCGMVLVAWGAFVEHPAMKMMGSELRVQRTYDVLVREKGAKLWAMGLTKKGSPRHPLYVRTDRPFESWEPG